MPYDEQRHSDAFSSPDLVTWTRHPCLLDHTRVACIDRMEFDAKGRILPVRITQDGVARRPLERSH